MAAPFSTLLSLIVMHGISMTVWRHLMNTTMPFSVRSNNNLPRFTFQLSNALTPPNGVDNLLTTLSPLSSSAVSSSSLTAPSSSLLSSSSSSPSSAYIQPIIQLHPIPISLPSLNGLQGLTGLTGLTGFPTATGSNAPMFLAPISTRPSEGGLVSAGYQFKHPNHQSLLTLSQLPAGQAVVQVSPTLVTQASTLKPIRIAPPFDFVPSVNPTVGSTVRGVQTNSKGGATTFTYRDVKLTGGKSSSSNNNNDQSQSLVTKKIGHSSAPIKLIANQSDEVIDLNSIITDAEMVNLQGDIKHKGFKSVCFYLIDDPEKGLILPINKIDPNLCNQIIVGFVYVGPDNLLWFQNPSNDVQRLKELVSLKTKNPKLQIILSIKMGQSKDNSTISTSGQSVGDNILASEERRNRFVRSLIEIVTLYNLDGVDFFRLHQNETKYRDTKSDLISLLKLTRKECLRKGKLDTLISATVTGHPDIASNYYNVTELVKSVDYLNLLTFDYHYYSEAKPYTGHHSLLYPRVTTHSGVDITSTVSMLKQFININKQINELK